MSAKAPLGSPSRNTGNDEAVVTSAISVGEVVSEVISHAAATSFIHMHVLEASHTSQSVRKVAMLRRARTLHALPYLLLGLTALFWSLNWVIGRAIAGHVTPFALVFIRWLVAIAVMMPFAWREVRAQWPAPRARRTASSRR